MVPNDFPPDGHLTVGTGISVMVLVLSWVALCVSIVHVICKA
jgi:hypothetical protein